MSEGVWYSVIVALGDDTGELGDRGSARIKLRELVELLRSGGITVTYRLSAAPDDVMARLHGLVATLGLHRKYRDVFVTKVKQSGNELFTNLIARGEDESYVKARIQIRIHPTRSEAKVRFPLAYGKEGTWLLMIGFTTLGIVLAGASMFSESIKASGNLETPLEAVVAIGVLGLVILILLYAGARHAVSAAEECIPLLDSAFHGAIISRIIGPEAFARRNVRTTREAHGPSSD